jgi:hypothetical protein
MRGDRTEKQIILGRALTWMHESDGDDRCAATESDETA